MGKERENDSGVSLFLRGSSRETSDAVVGRNYTIYSPFCVCGYIGFGLSVTLWGLLLAGPFLSRSSLNTLLKLLQNNYHL